MVVVLKTKEEYTEALKKEKVVIDFTASWCGPCRNIAPIYEQLDKDYPDIHFYKVDVDENSEVAVLEAIEAMPTFKFYHNGAAINELTLRGASEEKLKAQLAKLISA